MTRGMSLAISASHSRLCIVQDVDSRYDNGMNAALEIGRLRGAAGNAESWTRYLDAYRQELGRRTPEQVAAAVATVRARVQSYIGYGVSVGNLLDLSWRLTFSNLFDVGEVFLTPRELQEIRQEVRRLFLSHRDAMDMTRYVGDLFQSATGETLSEMQQLLALIERARALEESVFRDWPRFAEPRAEGTLEPSLPVDEALAEALNVDIDEARRRLEARRQKRDTANG